MDTRLNVTAWNSELEQKALAFLTARFASSMFLLGNFEDQGSRLTEQSNSGNFKLLMDSGEVKGVFCLTRRGNLLLSAEPEERANELILEACRREPMPIKGVIGEWAAASSFWEYLKEQEKIQAASFESREHLYQLREISVAEGHSKVRLLSSDDFSQWLPIRRAYTREEGLKEDLSDEALRANFERYTAMKEFWGYFESGRLLSTAALNARALDIGQVGGVYTVPEMRGRGFSRTVMKVLLSDCARIHNIRRMILFTGEKNLAAQELYQGLGFEKIGYFGIFFA